MASKLSQSSQKTKQMAQRLIHYVQTYPHVCIQYYASDMVLHISIAATYLVAPKAHNIVAEYFQLSNYPDITDKT